MFAVIIANPNSSSVGEIVSTHRTVGAAWAKFRMLPNQRWAYVAERRADGSYAHRAAATGYAAYDEGYEAQLRREKAVRDAWNDIAIRQGSCTL